METAKMNQPQNRLLKIGEILFLGAIAFLIIRKNTFPWPVKRISDILLFASLFLTTFSIIIHDDWANVKKVWQKIRWPSICIISGLLIATAINNLFYKVPFNNNEGILEFIRFTEVITIILLIGYFIEKNNLFYKKIALAQLSTLVYLSILFIPNNIYLWMYRFEFLENWPSNVSFYILVSLSLSFLSFLWKFKQKSLQSLFWFITSCGFAGILLWTQTRSAWIGTFSSITLIIFFWSRFNLKKIIIAILLFTLIFPLGFLLLKSNIKSGVFSRIFPGVIQKSNSNSKNPTSLTLSLIYKENITYNENIIYCENTDPRTIQQASSDRFRLWLIYGKRLLAQPIGIGLNYRPVNIGSGLQGPHNTLIELATLGGPLVIIGFLSLLIQGITNTYSAIKNNNIWSIYVLGSLIGLVIASQFDNMSTFRLMWLLIGLAIYFPQKEGRYQSR